MGARVSWPAVSKLPVLDHDAVLAARVAGRGDRAGGRRLRAPSPWRVGDAGQGLPAQPAERGLSRHARARWRPGPAQVGDLVPRQPRRGAAHRDRDRLPIRREHRGAADAARRAVGDRAAHRCGGCGGGPRAGRRQSQRGRDRLRPARRLGRALPGRRRLRRRRVPRPRPGGRAAAGRRAGLEHRLAGTGAGRRRGLLRDARRRGRGRGRRPAPRAALEHAGRRRPGQGGGDARPRSRPARCSATSGSRRPTAAS